MHAAESSASNDPSRKAVVSGMVAVAGSEEKLYPENFVR